MLLRDRESCNRLEFMAVLEAEEEWHHTQRDKLQSRLHRKQLQQRYGWLVNLDHSLLKTFTVYTRYFSVFYSVAQLEYDYFTKHEQIHDVRSIYHP